MSAAHPPAMPTVVRQPGSRFDTVTRTGDGATIGSAQPPAALLPSGGPPVPGPVLAPARALALDALRLKRDLCDPIARPGRWLEPTFVREVELVRCHLRPFRSRPTLAASFGRETFHGVRGSDEGRPREFSAVRVAYAVRWLELGDDDPRPTWLHLLAIPVSG